MFVADAVVCGLDSSSHCCRLPVGILEKLRRRSSVGSSCGSSTERDLGSTSAAMSFLFFSCPSPPAESPDVGARYVCVAVAVLLTVGSRRPAAPLTLSRGLRRRLRRCSVVEVAFVTMSVVLSAAVPGGAAEAVAVAVVSDGVCSLVSLVFALPGFWLAPVSVCPASFVRSSVSSPCNSMSSMSSRLMSPDVLQRTVSVMLVMPYPPAEGAERKRTLIKLVASL